jgi:hypothetical protein
MYVDSRLDNADKEKTATAALYTGLVGVAITFVAFILI